MSGPPSKSAARAPRAPRRATASPGRDERRGAWGPCRGPHVQLTRRPSAFTIRPGRRGPRGGVMERFPELKYEALQVGETFVSDTKLVTPEDIEAYAFAVDDHHTWFSEDSPFGGPIAHPTILANQALALRHSKYIVRAGLHAKMEFEFLEPIRP